ncbi:MAG: T9SS type A sorting domain-containing protein [Chitinophagales bacterium]|nr:T9SS type A sorting domain-containing protein [Chitinophagales bacterium]
MRCGSSTSFAGVVGITDIIKFSSRLYTYKFRFSNLKSGIYFIRFIYNGNVTNKKFIIE